MADAMSSWDTPGFDPLGLGGIPMFPDSIELLRLLSGSCILSL
jgi:hypothetical protein